MNQNITSSVESSGHARLLISFCNQLSSPNHSLCILEPSSGDSNWIDISEIPEVLRQNFSGVAGICYVGKTTIVIATQGHPSALACVDIIEARVTSYISLERTKDTHSLVFHDDYIYLVSTGTNEIYRVSFFDGHFGREELFWGYPSVINNKDEVHLNGLTIDQDRFIASCFGPKKDDGSWGSEGSVFYLDNGHVIRAGLNQPHSPLVADKRLIFAESGAKNVHIYSKNEDNEWAIKNEHQVNGYARGMVMKGDRIFVGISANRKASRSRHVLLDGIQGKNTGSAIVEIDYLTGMQVASFNLTGFGQEVYDIVLVNTTQFMKSMNDAICTRLNEIETIVTRYAIDVDRLFTEVQEKNKIINELVKDNLMLTPKVSIVIPVYNGSNFLESAIESALNQTYKNIEIIVVNDGSDDNGKTKNIAEKYLGKIKYFEKTNGGVSSALNLGISHMTGDYFAWLSHDDEFLPNKIEVQIKKIQDNNLNDDFVLFSSFEIFNAYTGVIAKAPEMKMPQINSAVDKYKWLLAIFESRLHGCTCLIPRSVFEKLGRFDESLKTTQDYDFFCRLLSSGVHFWMDDDCLIRTRHHEKQGTITLMGLHATELKEFFTQTINLFHNEFASYSFHFVEKFLNILKARSQYEAYIHLLNSWCSTQCSNDAPPLWLYWECKTGTVVPDYIYLCWKTVFFHCSRDFRITIITPETLPKYLPNIDPCYKKLEKIAHRADFIRFNLIYEYGGIWLDSDMVVLRSLREVMDDIRDVGFAAMGYKEHNSSEVFPIISFLASNPGNEIAGNMVKAMKLKIIALQNVENRQPEWDEIGGYLLLEVKKLAKAEWKFYEALEYFSFMPFWYENIPLLIENDLEELYEKIQPRMFCQSLTNSRDFEKLSIFNEKDILTGNNLLSNLFRISFSAVHQYFTGSIKQECSIMATTHPPFMKLVKRYFKAALSLGAWKRLVIRIFSKPNSLENSTTSNFPVMDVQTIFTKAYKENIWNSTESFSGEGSTLSATNVIRSILPDLLKKLDAKVFLDAPCGDFNWMQHVDIPNVNYIGGDIVKEIVIKNQQTYGNDVRRFVELDIIRSKLPQADVMLCRDCLIHLSYEHINSFIKNLHASGIKYLITNTYPNRKENINIETGRFRPVNLLLPPFNFPEPIKLYLEGCAEDSSETEQLYSDKSIGVWLVSDIPFQP